MKGIADTGFLVAFLNRNNQHHAWAIALAERVTEPLLTCEPVLAEAAFHVRSVPLILALLEKGLIRLSFAASNHLPQLRALAQRYADRQPDLADLCLVRMSEIHPRHSVLTTDRKDFRVYRRNKREVIPLICSPRDLPLRLMGRMKPQAKVEDARSSGTGSTSSATSSTSCRSASSPA